MHSDSFADLLDNTVISLYRSHVLWLLPFLDTIQEEMEISVVSVGKKVKPKDNSDLK